MKLEGNRAIVTGANRSIGRAIALLFGEEGADVVISYRSDKQGALEVVETLQAMGRKAAAYHADFSSADGVKRFFDEANGFLGGVDILINNASGYNSSAVFDLKPEAFSNLLQVGTVTPFYLIQLAAQEMKEGGAVINISSITGQKPYNNRIAFCSSKAALDMLTKCAALELGAKGIRVNAIAPGWTPYEGDDMTAQLDAIPLKRAGLPEDHARLALFLVSSDASWITGEVIAVDGGQSLTF